MAETWLRTSRLDRIPMSSVVKIETAGSLVNEDIEIIAHTVDGEMYRLNSRYYTTFDEARAAIDGLIIRGPLNGPEV